MIAAYELKHDKKRKEVKNSLTFYRLISFYREFTWLRKCIVENAYHQAIRELRFVLDSMLQAYYVDKRHQASNMMCKLEIIKEIERLHGVKMIKKTGLTHKTQLEKLYEGLCSYVHSSYKELVSSGPVTTETTRFDFKPDPELSQLCKDFVNRTIDAVFFISLSLFPEILQPELKFQKMRTSIIKSLRELGFGLALSNCAQH
jgi:hypothetical protein